MDHAVQFANAEISNETGEEITELNLNGVGIIPHGGEVNVENGTTPSVLVTMGGIVSTFVAQDSASLTGRAQVISVITYEGGNPVLHYIQIQGKTQGGILKWIKFHN